MCTLILPMASLLDFRRAICGGLLFCYTEGVKYIEINNIPQITFANKRITTILITVVTRGFVAPPFFFFLIVCGFYKGARWVHDVHVVFVHHMALVDAAGLSAQSLAYSELRAVVAESQR